MSPPTPSPYSESPKHCGDIFKKKKKKEPEKKKKKKKKKKKPVFFSFSSSSSSFFSPVFLFDTTGDGASICSTATPLLHLFYSFSRTLALSSPPPPSPRTEKEMLPSLLQNFKALFKKKKSPQVKSVAVGAGKTKKPTVENKTQPKPSTVQQKESRPDNCIRTGTIILPRCLSSLPEHRKSDSQLSTVLSPVDERNISLPRSPSMMWHIPEQTDEVDFAVDLSFDQIWDLGIKEQEQDGGSVDAEICYSSDEEVDDELTNSSELFPIQSDRE
eukprot:TRINITY_DN5577_c0_g1_i1.p1 TRINITY_DN5577_c0_g1~~TRINITY_DN5577_c0_g1_i1.p1  ORF type:complete len:272 (+),score=21.44 TRINITY_DN5577_c0_g1_i1:130-945(+)